MINNNKRCNEIFYYVLILFKFFVVNTNISFIQKNEIIIDVTDITATTIL
jgi:hypothetical protein